MTILLHIALFAAAFIIGGIPTGYIIVKLFRKRDIRNCGSGNIGFSNVLRMEGIGLGAIVLIIDAGKAFAAAFFLSLYYSNVGLFRMLLGITVILGNSFTPFLRFRGGKGVGAALGVALAINPLAALFALCGFVPAVAFTRYMSVGSLIAVTIFTVSSFIMYLSAYNSVYAALFSAMLFTALVARHISNIKRLIHGQENKIGSGKSG